MKEFKGTNENWILRENKSTIMSNENCLIARVFDGKGNSLLEHREQSDEIIHANSLLIAHAPEMLQMLEDILEQENVTQSAYDEISNLIKRATTI